MQTHEDSSPHRTSLSRDIRWGLFVGLATGVVYTLIGFVSILTGSGHDTADTKSILSSLYRGYMGAGFVGGLVLGVGRRFVTAETRSRLLGAAVGITAAFPISSFFYGPPIQWNTIEWVFTVLWGAGVGQALGGKFWIDKLNKRYRR
jgi:hypothetical protein